MRILILSDSFPPNRFASADMVAFRLANDFKKLGHDVFIITTVQDKLQEGEMVYGGLKIFKLYANFHVRWMAYLSLYNPQTVDKVEQIIKKIKPDIVHAHNIHFFLSYYCLKIAKQNGAGVFLTAHDVMLFHYGKLKEFINPDDFSCQKEFNYKVSAWQQIKRFKKRYNPLRNIIIRRYLKYVDKIFAVSHALKKALSDNDIKNVEVIYNGININDWKVEDNSILEFKNRFNLRNKKIILFCGKIISPKGAEKIIKAMKKIIEKIPGTILLMVGEKDRQAENILGSAKNLGVFKNLIFTGQLSGDNLKAAYWTSDIVAVPSICFDNFPTINLEAMASKKPVVGTCFGGTPEVVQDGVNGYIVNPFDVESLAEKIIDLLNSPQKAKKFGEAGYELVKNKFSLDAQVNNTLSWYKKFLSAF